MGGASQEGDIRPDDERMVILSHQPFHAQTMPAKVLH
jgi:hypothetical protein